MKKIFVILALMIFSSQLFAQEVQQEVKSKSDFYKNPDSPYEDAGQKHNDGVKYVMKKMKNKKNVTKEDIIDATAEFLNDNTANQVCAKLKPKLIPYKPSLMYANEINSALQNSKDLSSFITTIKSIEAKMITGKNINDGDIKVIGTLIALSVGRYSAFYWNNNDNSGGQGSRINWSKIKDDLEGAGTGAGIGSAIGGPGGAVIGGIAGAIIGSCCSAYSLPIGEESKN